MVAKLFNLLEIIKQFNFTACFQLKRSKPRLKMFQTRSRCFFRLTMLHRFCLNSKVALLICRRDVGGGGGGEQGKSPL